MNSPYCYLPILMNLNKYLDNNDFFCKNREDVYQLLFKINLEGGVGDRIKSTLIFLPAYSVPLHVCLFHNPNLGFHCLDIY